MNNHPHLTFDKGLYAHALAPKSGLQISIIITTMGLNVGGAKAFVMSCTAILRRCVVHVEALSSPNYQSVADFDSH